MSTAVCEHICSAKRDEPMPRNAVVGCVKYAVSSEANMQVNDRFLDGAGG